MTAPMSRREEVEKEWLNIYENYPRFEMEPYRSYALTLADEVDSLRAENERIRQNHGCARHQHTTQFCAEVAARDAIIDKLLAMLEPGVSPPKSHTSCDCVECRCHKINEERYARACEIAGRKE